MSEFPRITHLADVGKSNQRGGVHSVDGIVGACTATDFKEPKKILEPPKSFDYSKYRIRKLTPSEYGRLQGFPMDNWRQVVSNCQAYRQFGNAVSVPIIIMLGKRIKEFLDGQISENKRT